ncbi:MAG: cyclically-permuted mutarotase family protein, partial [Muribaculaceae bacterium]|nr:cyclically-permuted mutarotase family protein [Muribaculaceae bacterium]
MPKLPAAIDNAGAAFSDNVLYIIGGNINGQPSKTIFSLDLNSHNPEWKNCSTLEGNARTQPATAATRQAIIAAGGFAPKYEGNTEPTLDTDAIIFHTDGTKEHTCVPDDISLGGGTATAVGRNKILFTGGVNGKIFLDALKAASDDYLTHPAEWYRFNRHRRMLDQEPMHWTDDG